MNNERRPGGVLTSVTGLIMQIPERAKTQGQRRGTVSPRLLTSTLQMTDLASVTFFNSSCL